MNRRVLALLVALASVAAGAATPNFIVFLIDDLGATDLGCMGSKFYETPHIDRLAAQGMKFTQAYSACTVCSPTRAAMMTGKYPARLHITDWIAGHPKPFAKLKVPEWTKQLPLAEVTVAEALKAAGYATAQIGKWHLGGPAFYPAKQGFDISLGGTDKGQPPSYFSPYKIATLPDGPVGGFLTDRESVEACNFIETHREKPFYIYLSHHAVHTPLMGKKEIIAKYQRKAAGQPDYPQKNATYAALVESVDESVGRITRKLEELKLDRQTLILFTSDNGGLTLREITRNLGLRAGKGSAYEGGIRVPLIVKWPGVMKPGSTCEVPVMTIDCFPTILEIAGAPRAGAPDGESIVPLLKQTGVLKRDALFWHYPHYHPGGATPHAAVREGDLKLLKFYEDGREELYNLRADPSEKSNLSKTDSNRTAALATRLARWQKSVDAQFATPNPWHDAARPQP